LKDFTSAFLSLAALRIEAQLNVLNVQLCFRHFPIDGFSGKW